ncbi:MAG: response regulator transcription factor [Spirochaetales bacterium]|nr:response regulator transcription factor [Spirochaetales bacterium]
MVSQEGPGKFRFGIVENDADFREEVLRRLELLPVTRSVRGWPSAEQFLRDPGHEEVDILLLDIMLSGVSGVDLVRTISEKHPEMRVAMLTNMNSDAMIFDSIRNGAIGYILKSELGNLEEVVNVLASGGATITPTIALRVFSNFRRVAGPGPNLTERERQVLGLMVKGKSIHAVATFLGLSDHTVHGYVKTIYKKLNVHNRVELVTRARQLALE